MRNYELTLFLNSSAEHQSANDLLGRCSSFIQDSGGLVESQDTKGGAVIHGKKERKTACSMSVIRCALEPEKIADLNAYLAKDETILKRALLQAKAKQKFVPNLPRPFTPEKTEESGRQKEAINVADIDKEIEEIVNA